MPVIRRADDHRVDVTDRQQLAEILVGLYAGVAAAPGLGVMILGGFHVAFELEPIDIAVGDDLRSRTTQKCR